MLIAAALVGWGSAGLADEEPKSTGRGKRAERPSGPPARTFAPPGIAGGPAPDTPSVIPPPPGFLASPPATPPGPAPAPAPAPPPPPAPSAPPAPGPALPGPGPFAGVVGTLQVRVNDPADGQALALALGLIVRQISADRLVYSFAAPPGVDLVTLLHRLRGDPRVKSADLEALEFARPAR